MTIERIDSPVHYSLELVPESLRQSEIENAAARGEVLHTVDLSAPADLRWRKSFYFVQWECLEYFSFRLSSDGAAVSFSLSRYEYPEEVQYMVNVLKTLIGEINRNASVPLFTEGRSAGGLSYAECA